jgi:two-component system, chemotaxis family, protein-glutamate methylesterase/glutaminase
MDTPPNGGPQNIVVIGGSAGSVETVLELAKTLSAGLEAAVFLVIHFPANATSCLPELLSRAGNLTAKYAEDGEKVLPGRIYVARPNLHMLVEPGRISLNAGPRENSSRPSIDPLFRSAARAYGQRVIGVILSGARDDGIAGLQEIKQHGGITIIQDPQESLFPTMPQTARDNVKIDHVVSVSDLGRTISSLVGSSSIRSKAMTTSGQSSNDYSPDQPASFGCPECGGTLWQNPQNLVDHYRCRVGHAYSSESLYSEMSFVVEQALWTAVRALEERAELSEKLAHRMRNRNVQSSTALKFQTQAQQSKSHAETLRLLIQGDNRAFSGQALDELEGIRAVIDENPRFRD